MATVEAPLRSAVRRGVGRLAHPEAGKPRMPKRVVSPWTRSAPGCGRSGIYSLVRAGNLVADALRRRPGALRRFLGASDRA